VILLKERINFFFILRDKKYIEYKKNILNGTAVIIAIALFIIHQ